MITLQFIGYLGHDVVQKDVNGKSVLNFRAAETYRFKTTDGVVQERTTWINCAYWDRVTLAPYLLKGTQVYVEGIPSLETYVMRTGEVAAKLNVRVTYLQLLSPKPGTGGVEEVNHKVNVADDLPF